MAEVGFMEFIPVDDWIVEERRCVHNKSMNGNENLYMTGRCHNFTNSQSLAQLGLRCGVQRKFSPAKQPMGASVYDTVRGNGLKTNIAHSLALSPQGRSNPNLARVVLLVTALVGAAQIAIGSAILTAIRHSYRPVRIR